MGEFVICIHGGAGVIGKDMAPGRVAKYVEGLETALRRGRDVLAAGGAALDAVEAVVLAFEDDPLFNAGRGAVYTAAGSHELDASIMDGRGLACGAAACSSRVRHPVSLARAIMEKTPHVLLAGEGADRYAVEAGLETVDNAFFDDEYRYRQLLLARAAGEVKLDHADESRDGAKGTVGAVALDRAGNLAAATSTGGMTNKLPGRVGDTPIVGAGTYADNRSCAVSCTGTGEEFIRHAAAYSVHARMLFGGRSLEEACRELLFEVMKPGDGGLIAVGRDGSYAMPFNSKGMFRGVAREDGLFEVAIWE